MAGIFGRHGMFHDYLASFELKGMRRVLIELLRALDTKPEDRDPLYSSKEKLLTSAALQTIFSSSGTVALLKLDQAGAFISCWTQDRLLWQSAYLAAFSRSPIIT